jgi:hypothetical protein
MKRVCETEVTCLEKNPPLFSLNGTLFAEKLRTRTGTLGIACQTFAERFDGRFSKAHAGFSV